MKTSPGADNWREKYLGALGRLEEEQQQFRAMEAALKRIAGRLCTAALGQSSELDAQIKKLQTAMRRDTTSAEYEQIAPALTDAIRSLDQPPRPSPDAARAAGSPTPSTSAKTHEPAPVEPPLNDERMRAALSALLAELKRDAQLVSQANALDAKLGAPLTRDQLGEALASLTEMVSVRIKRIEHAKEEIEVLLNHMVGKLDEIGEFVAEQTRSQNESQASSETLNIQLAGEMKAMGESVEAAGDLQQIRSQVRNRLDSIDRHLQAFREREAMLASAMRARNDQMHARIAELEGEAKRLHAQLQDEQRLSTIDALTKIPNRLAYEKRAAEELKRFERFKQPTCIAVWDVDHFKRINDTYGHRAGDRVLTAVADCLAARIRGTDFVARYGGEEFVMLLPGASVEDAMRVADQLRTAISEIGFHFRGAPIPITISSGLTALRAGDTAEAAFDRADKALYEAKQNGRNRCMSG